MSGIPVAPESDPNAPWGQMLPTKIEANLPPYPTDAKPKDGEWQVVNGTRFKFFVFSAFYDRRDGRMIRVIGATKTRGPEKVWCRMWYPVDGNNTRFRSISVMARVKVIRENWNLKYSACFILCPLRISYLDVPYSVSIVAKLRSPPGNILMLRNTDSVSFPHEVFQKPLETDNIFDDFRIQILPIVVWQMFQIRLLFVSSLYILVMIRWVQR